MKNALFLLAFALVAGAPLSAHAAPTKPASSTADLTAQDYQFLKQQLDIGQDDDLLKNLTTKQRGDLHKLIVAKTDSNTKLDQVSSFLANVFADSLVKTAKA